MLIMNKQIKNLSREYRKKGILEFFFGGVIFSIFFFDIFIKIKNSVDKLNSRLELRKNLRTDQKKFFNLKKKG